VEKMENCLYCKIWKAMYYLNLDKYKILFENFPTEDLGAIVFKIQELEMVNVQKRSLEEDKDVVELVNRIEAAAERGQIRIGSMEVLTKDLKKIADEMMEEKEIFH